jgi:methyl-accepting chemotaxis protein
MPIDAEMVPGGRFTLKWTLARKVGGLAALLLIILLAVSVYNFFAIGSIGAEMAEVAEADLPITKLLTQVETDQLQRHIALERLLRVGGVGLATQRQTREMASAEYARLTRQFDEDMLKVTEAVEQAGRSIPEYQRVADELRQLGKQRQDVSTVSARVIDLVAAGRTTEADGLVDQIEQETNELDEVVTRLLREIEGFTTNAATVAQAHAVSAKGVSAGLSIAGTLAAFGLTFVFVRGLRRSVTGVTGLALQIADGNLKQEKLAVRTSDEMGQLTLIFNQMIDGLRENVVQTRSAAESLTAAVSEIAASVKEQAASTSEQAAAVQETTATMEEINQSGNQIAERARQVAAAAEATSTATAQGMDAAKSGSKIMEAIQEQAETVAENIVTLSEKTQAVGDIIATVTDIAEQSNLLALNAAIEAAAAGEQGRSFAVVANEIKNLADQAKEATGKVRSILGDIQKGINTSVMLTEEVVKRVDSGKKQTDIVEHTIRHMAESLNSSVQAFQQITAATGQQQIGFDQVTQALKNIRQASDQTAVSTSQLEKAATNLTVLGHQLTTNVEAYRT